MTQPPPDPSARNALLLAFPVRLYTALRTVRLDPAATPRTLHSIDLLEQTFRSLLAAVGEDRVELAVVEQHLLVCSEQLSDRDQARPQIQGLITLFLHLQVHGLTLHTALTRADFTRFALLLAGLPEGRVPPEPLPVLVDRAGLHSIVVASRRCAAPGAPGSDGTGRAGRCRPAGRRGITRGKYGRPADGVRTGRRGCAGDRARGRTGPASPGHAARGHAPRARSPAGRAGPSGRCPVPANGTRTGVAGGCRPRSARSRGPAAAARPAHGAGTHRPPGPGQRRWSGADHRGTHSAVARARPAASLDATPR